MMDCVEMETCNVKYRAMLIVQLLFYACVRSKAMWVWSSSWMTSELLTVLTVDSQSKEKTA